jgi:polysaccharide transporter, PST family
MTHLQPPALAYAALRARLAAELRSGETRQWGMTISGSLGRLAIGFVSSVIMARVLGPAGYGVVALVSAVLGICDTAGDFGLTYAAVRAIARVLKTDSEQARRLAHGYFVLAFITNTVAAVAGIAFARPIALLLGRPESELYIQLALLGLIAVAGNGFVMAVLQSTQRFGSLAMLQVLTSLTYLAGIAALAAVHALDIATVVVLGAANPLIGFVVGLRLLPAGFVALHEPAVSARRAWPELMAFGKWVWIATLLALLATQLDLLMINHWLPAVTVGSYALALNLALKADILSQTRLTVLLPAVSALRTRREMEVYIRRQMVIGGLLCLPFAGAMIAAGPLVMLIYGPAYSGAVPVLLVLLGVVLFDLITSPLFLLAYPLNAPRVLAASDLMRVATLALAGTLFIPGLAATGAALAKLLAKIVGAAFALAMLWRAAARVLDEGGKDG